MTLDGLSRFGESSRQSAQTNCEIESTSPATALASKTCLLRISMAGKAHLIQVVDVRVALELLERSVLFERP